MKKLIALLLAQFMVLGLVACGGKNTVPDKPDTPDAPVADVPTEDQGDDLPGFTFTQYGNAKITIVGAEFAKDDYGDDFLRIYYDYTNTGDTAIDSYPSVALDYGKITQGGQEKDALDTVFTLSDADECVVPEDLTNEILVQPGCTARHTMLLRCSPDDGALEVSCYIMIGDHVYEEGEIEYFTFRIDPKDMMGAPAPQKIPAITNPTYIAGLPSSGSTDYPNPLDVSINGWELTKGYDGENVLRIKLTMTNNTEDVDLAPMSLIRCEAYQDGISLPWFDTWDLEEYTYEDEAFREDVYAGDTVDFNVLVLLRNDSPVEFVIEQKDDEMRLGILCDVASAIADNKAEETEAQNSANEAASSAVKALVGTWEAADGWDDAITFRADSTGIQDMTGDEYPFSFELEGDTLYLHYDDGDEGEYTYRVNGDELVLADAFDNEQSFNRVSADAPTTTEAPAEVETEETDV